MTLVIIGEEAKKLHTPKLLELPPEAIAVTDVILGEALLLKIAIENSCSISRTTTTLTYYG